MFRVCIEYPEYANINGNDNKIMDYPIEENEEIEFDQKISYVNKMICQNHQWVCLEDLYIIQKWIDYGKGIKDKTCKQFENILIIFDNIYKIANNRKKLKKFNSVKNYYLLIKKDVFNRNVKAF